MDGPKLTDRQAAELAAKVRPMSDYLARLLARMNACDWRTDDRLLGDVDAAASAMRRVAERLRPATGGAGLRFKREPRDKRLRERDTPWGARGE